MQTFDELFFFARIKERPALLLGKKSLTGLRDLLVGMDYAFRQSGRPEALRRFAAFARWYPAHEIGACNAYGCWWNHLLYTSGNFDEQAFDAFFRVFERYLRAAYGERLPEADFSNGI